MNTTKGGLPLKIAIFSDTCFPQVNGVALSLKRLTDHLEKRKIQFEIFTPEINDAPSYPNINQFFSLPFLLYPECRTVIANPQKIKAKLQQFQPDIIHIATPYMMGLYGLFSAKSLKIPVVSSYHTHFDQYLKYYKTPWLLPLLWKYLRWFHDATDRTFVPTKETKKKLEDLGFQSLRIWSRGVDSFKFHPFFDSYEVRRKYHITQKFVLLYVGRFAPEKDLKTLNNIIDQFPSPYKENIHWLLVGDGPNFQEWKKKMGILDNITLTGYLKGADLAEMYASADLFIFPSSTETFGNVVLESLSSGTPAIVANEGGVKEIVQHNITGKICKKKNEHEFISGIIELLRKEDLRHNMGKAAREYALQQSWESILDGLIEEYRNVLEEKQLQKQKYA